VQVTARYADAEGSGVRCRLCPNNCLIRPGHAGRCLGRRNVGGRLYAVNYGEVVSAAVDPVEKKPLYHFHPGESVFSVATYGCNLLCPFCQNAEISQTVAPTRYVAPEELVRQVQGHGLRLAAFTYTEPLVWFEYLLDACRLTRAAGIKNVLVTNGMVNSEPLGELLPLIDAMNIDLKSIRPEFYRDYVRGDLSTVLSTIRAARQACHVELTTLLIPGRNDSNEEIAELVEFAAGLGRNTVLHFSRYFRRHRAGEPETPAERLLHAAEVGRAKLDYVYVGNFAAGPQYRDTLCPKCGVVLVDRSGYAGVVQEIAAGKCRRCGRAVDMVL
jgi:pyruvate formate lyase activating enzyme